MYICGYMYVYLCVYTYRFVYMYVYMCVFGVETFPLLEEFSMSGLVVEACVHVTYMHSMAFFHPNCGPLLVPGSHVSTLFQFLFSSLVHIRVYMCIYLYVYVCLYVYLYISIHVSVIVILLPSEFCRGISVLDCGLDLLISPS